jgi:hypothetical protein
VARVRPRLRRLARLVGADPEQRPAATATPVYESEELPFDGRLAAEGHGYPGPFADPERPCSGCVHSASGAPFPGHPSGERPCCFCIRNPNGIDVEALRPGPAPEAELEAAFLGGKDSELSEYVRKARQAPEGAGIWYDGSPAWKTPMDNYIATDRSQQQQIWDALDRFEREGRPIPERESYATSSEGRVWCCEGGDGPKGHTWSCWRWRGVSFG